MSLARLAVAAATTGLVLGGCVSARLIREPTPPAPDWSVYSSASVGIAIAMPPGWRAFDLTTDGTHPAALAWAKGSERGAVQLELAVQRFVRDGRARFFAVDTDQTVGGPQASVAYAIRLAAPPEGVDAFAANAPQAPGRRVAERRHVKGDAGDLLMQRIEQEGEVKLAQYQFLIVIGPTLHALFIELPEQAMAAGGAAKAERMGTSFTPIGSP